MYFIILNIIMFLSFMIIRYFFLIDFLFLSFLKFGFEVLFEVFLCFKLSSYFIGI